MHVTDKIICTSRPDCPCKFCGQVRLLFAQEEQRESETPCQICAREEIRLTIFECPLCGEPGLLPEVNALALDYITELERRKP